MWVHTFLLGFDRYAFSNSGGLRIPLFLSSFYTQTLVDNTVTQHSLSTVSRYPKLLKAEMIEQNISDYERKSSKLRIILQQEIIFFALNSLPLRRLCAHQWKQISCKAMFRNNLRELCSLQILLKEEQQLSHRC